MKNLEQEVFIFTNGSLPSLLNRTASAARLVLITELLLREIKDPKMKSHLTVENYLALESCGLELARITDDLIEDNTY